MSDLHKLNTVRRSFSRHHNAEDALRESDAKFRALASTVPVTIYEFQCTSVGRSFTFVSDKILELAGIRAQDMLADADSFYDLIHPADLDALLSASALAVAAKSRFSHEFRIVKSDGKVVWILANSLQFGGEVDAGVWIGCMQDVTGRKQADLSLKESNRHVLDFIKLTEQQFLHKELLEVQKTESLGALAGGLAHDFNNILIGIMGNISFAQMCLVDRAVSSFLKSRSMIQCCYGT